MDFDFYKSDIALLMEVDAGDVNYLSMLPSMITAAENRIYRELDLLSTVVTDASATFTAMQRGLALPTSPRFVTTQQLNVITPVGVAPDAGMRKPLTPVTKEFLDAVWNSSAGAGVPSQFAMLDDQTVIVGPWPDAGYTVEIVGTIQPEPLSAANTETFLTRHLYDLFQAASMVFAMSYQRDGASGAGLWETAYGKLSTSAGILEARKKYQSSAWASQSPAPVATPGRGQG